jgi:hypothetical protein
MRRAAAAFRLLLPACAAAPPGSDPEGETLAFLERHARPDGG